tara:strand:- start:1633 stop:2181 length:549 start_codon:yes stop_codon:yes gene_type:complete
MKKIFILLIFLIPIHKASASIKEIIIQKLVNIDNLNFEFEQNINNKIETGKCTIQYPKKIYCKYDSDNKKILVSNGRSLVIKTLSGYYLYPLNKTPLDIILDKNYLINKINNVEERIVDNKFINYNFFENDNEINLFFDTKTHNLIGWQTLDLYQNLSITYLSSITKNQKLKKNLFKLPERN